MGGGGGGAEGGRAKNDKKPHIHTHTEKKEEVLK